MSENERLLSLNLSAGQRPTLYIRAGSAKEIVAALDEVAAAGLYGEIANAADAFRQAAGLPSGTLF